MTSRWGLILLVLVTAGILFAAPTSAHQFAPALLELEEIPGDGELAAVSWKQPMVRVMGSRLQPVLPGECEGVGDPVVQTEGTGMRATWQIRCPGGLAGKTVGVEGIAESRANVLLRVALADGRKLQTVLEADTSSYQIQMGAGRWGLFRDYLVLGLDHILGGWDHLVFVLALVFLVGGGTRLLWTVTAFTLGHSVTLALASLGLVYLPQGPTEIAIAFSIFLLAVELSERREGHQTLTQRAPWLVASTFGLLHGLGFAGALSEVGLPSAEIPLALFSFNVGIELGQLLFVAVVLVLGFVIRRIVFETPRWAYTVPAYAIGTLAVFWIIERI